MAKFKKIGEETTQADLELRSRTSRGVAAYNEVVRTIVDWYKKWNPEKYQQLEDQARAKHGLPPKRLNGTDVLQKKLEYFNQQIEAHMLRVEQLEKEIKERQRQDAIVQGSDIDLSIRP